MIDAADAQHRYPKEIEPLSELLPGTERALLARIAAEQATHRAPSVVATVVRDGRPVWFGARGTVGGGEPTAGTQYRIGSITKTFVAVLVMRLRDEGRLDLSDRVDAHLPGTPVGDRTVAQLLAHTAGLTAEPAGQWWERTAGGGWDELAGSMDAGTARFRGGRRFHYSNLGFGVLGELVARLRGTSWAEAAKAEILDPLIMARTTFRPVAPHARGWAVHPWADVLLAEPEHDAGAMAPAGQLWSTASDLARWAAFVGGDTGGVLSPDTVAEMREPAGVEDADAWVSGYGLGIQLRRAGGRRLAGHTGSMPGFLAALWVDPAEGVGAAVAANVTAGPPIGVLAADLVDILVEHEPRLPGPWQPLATVDRELLELTGPWYWGAAPHVLRLLPDGWLELVRIGQGRAGSRFRPDRAGAGAGPEATASTVPTVRTWTGLDGYYAGETLRMGRRPDGSVSHLELATFVFTRTPYDPDAPVPGGVDPAGWRPGQRRDQ